MRSCVTLVLAVVLSCVAAVPAASAAAVTGKVHAATSAPPDLTGLAKVEQPMSVIGYDLAVAQAHGDAIIDDENGIRSVKVSDGDQPVVVDESNSSSITMADQVVSGSCGVSFLYYEASGRRRAEVYTGFDLTSIAPAISFGWTVSVTDAVGVGSRSWGGATVGYGWDKSWTTKHGTSGYSWAIVSDGWALRADGIICSTGHPWDDTNLY